MQQILVLGAGRSAGFLLQRLDQQASAHDWQIVVADADWQTLQTKTQGLSRSKAIALDLNQPEQCRPVFEASDLVISLLPPRLHLQMAEKALAHNCHFLTASYEEKALRELQPEVLKRGLTFLSECGLDPGIDHLSALHLLEKVRLSGKTIQSFYSLAGGLLEPAAETNPWNYKITWNPRNVLNAGKGGGTALEAGHPILLPYPEVFQYRLATQFRNGAQFEAYPNRDSLAYREVYPLEGVANFMRGTLRRPRFAEGWHFLAREGYTDTALPVDTSLVKTYRQLSWALGLRPGAWDASPARDLLDWLGLFEDKPLPFEEGSPADALLHLLKEKWHLEAGEQDRILMQHRCQTTDGQTLCSELIYDGEPDGETAMAKLVGLPLALAAEHVMSGQAPAGVQIPTSMEWRQALLPGLAEEEVVFEEYRPSA